jgi:hypothetical protein
VVKEIGLVDSGKLEKARLILYTASASYLNYISPHGIRIYNHSNFRNSLGIYILEFRIRSINTGRAATTPTVPYMVEKMLIDFHMITINRCVHVFRACIAQCGILVYILHVAIRERYRERLPAYVGGIQAVFPNRKLLLTNN